MTRRRTSFFRKPELWVLAVLALVLSVGSWVISSRQTPQNTTKEMPAPTTTATPSGPASLPSSGRAGETPDIASLKEAVFTFEEVYFSPLGDKRNARLMAICTSEAYRSLRATSIGASLAYKSMKDMSFAVNRKGDNIVTPEALDQKGVMSVYSQIWIVSSRGKEVVNTFRVSHMTSWIKIGDVWKLGFFDYGAVAYDFSQGA